MSSESAGRSSAKATRPPPASPYPGPRPFEAAEQERFFGREVELRQLFSLVVANPLVVLHSESGAGKSSLVNAGLIPRLLREGFDVLPVARVGGALPQAVRGSAIPNVFVLNALAHWCPDRAPSELLPQTMAGHLATRPILHDADGLVRPRVLIFDQFEELVRSHEQRWADRRGFMLQLADALAAEHAADVKEPVPLRVVLPVREDFLGPVEALLAEVPSRQASMRLERLREREARRAIEGPLAGTGRSFAPGVVDDLVRELLKMRVQGEDGRPLEVTGEFVEPVQLQIVCQTIWAQLAPGVTEITADLVNAVADVDEALVGFYEGCVQDVARRDLVGEDRLRRWFETKMITAQGTKGTADRGPATTGGLPNAAVDALEQLHLIRAERRSGAPWYELTHDRFIGPITRANALRQQQRRARRTLWLRTAASIAFLGLAGWSVAYPWRHRADQRRLEETANRYAALADSELTRNPDRGLLLAVEGARLRDDSVTNRALARSLAIQGRTRAIFRGHRGFVDALAVAPGGQLVASAGRDTTVRLWSDGEVAGTLDSINAVPSALAFSPSDGRRLAVGFNDGTAGIWNSSTHKRMQRLPRSSSRVRSLAFSPDSLLAIASGNAVRIWRPRDSAVVTTLTGHLESVRRVLFSSDGHWLLTVSGDGAGMIWQTRGWRLAGKQMNFAGRTWDAALTSDARWVALFTDSAVNVYTRSGKRVKRLNPGTPAYAGAFAPNELLVAGGRDHSLRVWSLSSGNEVIELRGHTGSVLTLAPGAGGRVFSAAADSTVREWDLLADTVPQAGTTAEMVKRAVRRIHRLGLSATR